MTVDLHAYGMETTLVTGDTGDYRIENVPPGQVELIFKLINLDLDYFYTSRLPGELLGGVNVIHLHPSLPRTTRVTLQWSF